MEIDRFCERFVRNAPDAIIYADEQGVIQFWNGSAERIFGFAEAEALGKTLDIIIPESLRGRHWQGYAATMQSGNTRYGAGEILAVPAPPVFSQRGHRQNFAGAVTCVPALHGGGASRSSSRSCHSGTM